jgi:hypothetical protein
MIPNISDFGLIIENFEIIEHKNQDGILILRLEINLIDSSTLFVTDIFVSFENRRKYSFHWQDSSKNLICRWDNAPHFQKLKTYPHHKHLSENIAIESDEMTLRDVFKIIQEKLKE